MKRIAKEYEKLREEVHRYVELFKNPEVTTYFYSNKNHIIRLGQMTCTPQNHIQNLRLKRVNCSTDRRQHHPKKRKKRLQRQKVRQQQQQRKENLPNITSL